MVQNIIPPSYLSSLRIPVETLSSFCKRYIHLDRTLNDLKQTFCHENWGSEEDIQLDFFLIFTGKSLSIQFSFGRHSLFPKKS